MDILQVFSHFFYKNGLFCLFTYVFTAVFRYPKVRKESTNRPLTARANSLMTCKTATKSKKIE